MLSPLLLVLSSLLPQSAADQEPLAVASTMDRVTVYQGQALIERLVRVESQTTGALSIVVSQLPLGADASSFQTRVESGSLVVQGLELRQRSGEAIGGPEREAFNAELRALGAERRSIETRVRGVDAGKGALQAMMQGLGAGGEQFQGMPASAAEMLRFFVEEAEKLDQDMAELERQLEEVDGRIADIHAQLDADSRAPRQDFQEARVSLFFERPGAAVLRLSYLVYGAWWTPTYDVRVAPDLTGVRVGLVAQVSQQSGEDWADAQLLLSTSTPSIGLDPPPVPRRWMGFATRGVLRALGYAAGDELDGMALSRAPMEDSRTASLGLAFDAEAAYEAAPTVGFQDLGLTAQFVLPERKDIPSNGKPHRFVIREMPLQVRPERYVVPSLSDHAYLRAEVTLSGETPLLPGVAKVFLGPDFLGEASMPLLRQGDSTMLNLGIDHNLTVEFEEMEDRRENPGRFSLSSTAHIVRTYRAKLKLSAAARGPIELIVEESLPLAQDDRIEISATSLSPSPEDGEEEDALREERGLLRWKLRLEPGAGATVRWGYDMAFPYKMFPIMEQD